VRGSISLVPQDVGNAGEYSLSVPLVCFDQLVEFVPPRVGAETTLGYGKGEDLASVLKGDIVYVLELLKDILGLNTVGKIAAGLVILVSDERGGGMGRMTEWGGLLGTSKDNNPVVE
jgi:hypothetical protein